MFKGRKSKILFIHKLVKTSIKNIKIYWDRSVKKQNKVQQVKAGIACNNNNIA